MRILIPLVPSMMLTGCGAVALPFRAQMMLLGSSPLSAILSLCLSMPLVLQSTESNQDPGDRGAYDF